jgi:hypothetical protein
MLAGRRANGALKIRSEPALVAATPEMGSILVVQDALPVGKLVQVEVAAEVQPKGLSQDNRIGRKESGDG